MGAGRVGRCVRRVGSLWRTMILIAPECGMCDKLIGDALIEAQTWAPDDE